MISKSINSEIQKKITIIGNKYIDSEIIFSIIENKITDYSNDNLNEIIKTLYETGNFKTIQPQVNQVITMIISRLPCW